MSGFEVERMLFRKGKRWYNIRDPKLLGHRLELQSSEHRLLYISARRTQEKPIFASPPQQSDYAAAWTETHRALETSSGTRWAIELASLFPGFLFMRNASAPNGDSCEQQLRMFQSG
jgi:hypothetical protein